MMKESEISIKEEYIRLDSLLKFAGLIGTGGMAKAEIQSGNVKVNGEICTARGKKMRSGDKAEYGGSIITVKNADK